MERTTDRLTLAGRLTDSVLAAILPEPIVAAAVWECKDSHTVLRAVHPLAIKALACRAPTHSASRACTFK